VAVKLTHTHRERKREREREREIPTCYMQRHISDAAQNMEVEGDIIHKFTKLRV